MPGLSSFAVYIREEGNREGNRHFGLRAVQAEKLYHDQKQTLDPGQAGVQEVLSFLSHPYSAQRNEVDERGRADGFHRPFLGFSRVDPSFSGQTAEPAGQ